MVRAKDGEGEAVAVAKVDEHHMANARLIAAAPELLEALKRLVAGVERAAAGGVGLGGHVGVGDALAAIAKAEGVE